jgi:hypothetical protein
MLVLRNIFKIEVLMSYKKIQRSDGYELKLERSGKMESIIGVNKVLAKNQVGDTL